MLRSVPVICIAGPSASGKTTLAGALEQHLAREGLFALRLSCDDYYRQDWVPHAIFGYDTVDAIDTVVLKNELASLRRRRPINLRHYDMRLRRVSRRTAPSRYDLILLEGAYGPQALHGSADVDVLVYLQASLLRRLFRRLRRDVVERHRSPGYVIRQMFTEMLPGERAFIEPLRAKADLIVRNERLGLVQISALIERLLDTDSLRADFNA